MALAASAASADGLGRPKGLSFEAFSSESIRLSWSSIASPSVAREGGSDDDGMLEDDAMPGGTDARCVAGADTDAERRGRPPARSMRKNHSWIVFLSRTAVELFPFLNAAS
jgi:hypothetical protein